MKSAQKKLKKAVLKKGLENKKPRVRFRRTDRAKNTAAGEG